ncbi:hypothetical protein CHU98_g4635 [Xylaria longipes]|nr:hypothetical protein CHU98_g4635 [Xylaria longipes]
MKSFLTLIAWPAAALAASIPGALTTPTGPFSAGAWKTDLQCTDIFFFGTAINASGGKFYINRNTSTYCPDGVSGLNCSAFSGTGTTLVTGSSTTTMSLDVTVPGGQQGKYLNRFISAETLGSASSLTPPTVYIAPDGSLSYTQAHSASMPANSIVVGFSRQQSEAFGAPVYLYSADQYWYLCPVTEGEPRERTYQIFASTKVPKGCYVTQIRTYTPDAGKVWQYA